MKKFGFITTALIVLVSASAARAQEEHSDVEIAIEDGMLDVHERVTEGEFGSELNPANTTDDPGFAPEGAEDTPATTTFVGGQQVAFQTVDLGSSGMNLWYWDGAGSPMFGASPHDLTIARTGAGSIDLSSGNGGFTMFAADGGGFFDEHIDFTLSEATPDTGVYVFGMTLGSPNASPAVLDSDPVYFVMASQGLDEAIHEAAVGYVEANLVPEPGSQITMLIGMVMFMGLRRRFSQR